MAVNFAVEELSFQKRVTVLPNRIAVCVSQQLQRSSNSSFFQFALLRCWQPLSVMTLLAKYKQSYRGITFAGVATLPSRVAYSRYLRFCCRLIYTLITEVEESQSADVCLTEGDAPLFPNAVSICI